MRQPPALSRWLLERLVSHEPLAGDLLEEYASGRSATWYMTQVLSAIIVSASKEIRSHKWLTLRAILLGWAFLMWWVNVFNLLSWKQWSDDAYGILPVAIPAAGFFASGWVVGRLHRPLIGLPFVTTIILGSVLRYFGLTPWLLIQPDGLLALVAPLSILGGLIFSRRSDRTGSAPLRLSSPPGVR